MGRAPCCEKMGLKKGPWTPEEDQILISYINLHGHSNWRALPKHAGLSRCGKSCRLRWTNYLRPDIKRGNFTQEEEETIIKLHEMLGNRWSTIAAELPGRTDNEIKNVWHTHLKKRLPKQNEPETGSTITPVIVEPAKKQARKSRASKKSEVHEDAKQRKHVKSVDGPVKNINKDYDDNNNNENEGDNVRPTSLIKLEPVSPQSCTSEVSTITSPSASENSANENDNFCEENVGYTGDFPEFNDDFWIEVLSVEATSMSTEDIPSVSPCHISTTPDVLMGDPMCVLESKVHIEEMDNFWRNLLTRTDDVPEFTEIM